VLVRCARPGPAEPPSAGDHLAHGTFGAGKITTGSLSLRMTRGPVHGLHAQERPADHDFTDFQQSPRGGSPSWSRTVIRVTNQHLVAVQTVLDEDYWRELRSGLTALGHEVLHVVIEADQQVMRQRIHGDEKEPQAAKWRIDHLPTYAAARTWMTAARSGADTSTSPAGRR
jgi:hypothetical protein